MVPVGKVYPKYLGVRSAGPAAVLDDANSLQHAPQEWLLRERSFDRLAIKLNWFHE